ncbi:hypothetical protein DOY81_009613, partial [Sarcophaga bullata]
MAVNFSFKAKGFSMLANANYWRVVVTAILQNYFSHVTTTTCILRHNLFADILEPSINSNVYLQINPVDLQESFEQDVYNFTQQDKYFNDNQIKPIYLVIEGRYFNASTFSIKTINFVGSLDEHPEQLLHLTTYNALERSFTPEVDLFLPDKLKDLQGREVIVAAFNYRPFVALEYDYLPLYPDRAEDNPTHLVHVDGVETRITHTFCELYTTVASQFGT